MLEEVGSQSKQSQRRKPRYAAATFYLVLTVALFVFGVSGNPQSLIGAAVVGLYTVYLFRGGRFVLFFW